MKKPYLQREIFSVLPDHQTGETLRPREIMKRIGRVPDRNSHKSAVSRSLRRMAELGLVVRTVSGYARRRREKC